LHRPRILLTSTHSAAFVLQDLSLLRKHFEVEHLVTTGLTLWNLPWRVARCDVTFTWFASVYSFAVVLIATLLRKPSIVVIAGADIVSLPEIGYGLRLSCWKQWVVKRALRMATRVLAVDPYLLDEANRFTGISGSNIEVLPTGYDVECWTPGGSKESMVLTVAGCENENRMKVKGIDFLFEIARAMKDAKFVLVGVREPLRSHLQENRPANLEVVPFSDQPTLLSYYRRARVYCQPSRSEGLPNSVCEAMLCECIPVGTDVGGMTTALGRHGFTARFGDLPGMVDALRRAMEAPASMGQDARAHISREFPLSRREKGLKRIIEEVLG
jgi:glycosyltransferase involved in cell wall biosynthesis